MVDAQQPVRGADALQAASVVVLQPVAHVEVEQLGGEQSGAVRPRHRVADGVELAGMQDDVAVTMQISLEAAVQFYSSDKYRDLAYHK